MSVYFMDPHPYASLLVLKYSSTNMLVCSRTNRIRILEYLRDTWVNNQRSEWSVWMVKSEIDVPHRYLRSGVDVASQFSILGRVSLTRRTSEDVIIFI